MSDGVTVEKQRDGSQLQSYADGSSLQVRRRTIRVLLLRLLCSTDLCAHRQTRRHLTGAPLQPRPSGPDAFLWVVDSLFACPARRARPPVHVLRVRPTRMNGTEDATGAANLSQTILPTIPLSTNNPFKVFVDGSRKQRAANGIVLTVAANGDKVQENPDGSVITTYVEIQDNLSLDLSLDLLWQDFKRCIRSWLSCSYTRVHTPIFSTDTHSLFPYSTRRWYTYHPHGDPIHTYTSTYVFSLLSIASGTRTVGRSRAPPTARRSKSSSTVQRFKPCR